MFICHMTLYLSHDADARGWGQIFKAVVLFRIQYNQGYHFVAIFSILEIFFEKSKHLHMSSFPIEWILPTPVFLQEDLPLITESITVGLHAGSVKPWIPLAHIMQ